jgi:orotate phosphoribosyltransferase
VIEAEEAMVAERSRLLEILTRTSFRREKEAVFKLASGAMSEYYVDCKYALSDPEARKIIGKLIYDLVKNETYDAVGGLEIGAYPIATSVSDRIYQENAQTVRAFVVRKQAKSHGIRSLLAGDVNPGDRALIVDDVITTGNSTIDAVERTREAGLIVSRVIVLVDRNEGDGKKNIEAHGVTCASLFSLADLIAASKSDAKSNAPTHSAGLR